MHSTVQCGYCKKGSGGIRNWGLKSCLHWMRQTLCLFYFRHQQGVDAGQTETGSDAKEIYISMKDLFVEVGQEKKRHSSFTSLLFLELEDEPHILKKNPARNKFLINNDGRKEEKKRRRKWQCYRKKERGKKGGEGRGKFIKWSYEDHIHVFLLNVNGRKEKALHEKIRFYPQHILSWIKGAWSLPSNIIQIT